MKDPGNRYGIAGFLPSRAATLAATAILTMLFLSCASPSIYSIDPHYLPSPEKEQVSRGATLTLALFTDDRQLDDNIVLGRVIERGGRVTPVLPRHREPQQVVIQALSACLTLSGHSVAARHPRWDLREESIDQAWGRILIGGTINDLFIEYDRSKPLHTCSARVKLTLVLADVEEKRILHRVTVETKSQVQHLRFSETRIEEELSNALSEALEKVFAESEVMDIIASIKGEGR